MKKNLFVCAALLLAFKISYAQTEKGTQTLGLDFGASRSTTNQSTINPVDNSTQSLGTAATNFTFGPNYSYFIADKLDIGAALSYQASTQTYTATSAADNSGYPTKYSNKNFDATVYIRKYYMYKNMIGFRTGAYFIYSDGTDKTTYLGTYAASSSSGTSHQYDAQLRLDLVYYPSKRLGVSANIAEAGYSWYKANSVNQPNSSGDSANINFVTDGLQLSVFYIFGSK
jgi:hypothetical protein